MDKALYFEILHYDPANIELLKRYYDVVVLHDPSFVKEDTLKDVSVVFAPMGYFFGKDLMDRALMLKIIATNTTGTPHIDVNYAESRGIKVFSLKGETTFLKTITPTAELTMGLIIALTRNIPFAFQSVLAGKWSRWEFGGPCMLSSMTLGIIGLGRLGSIVARYALGFGMDVKYYDPFVEKSDLTALKKIDTLQTIVSSSDIISVHIPMEESNRNLFDHNVFSNFKRGSYFINTSRGELVDSAALVQALENKRITGAALDVLDGEFEPCFQEKVNEHQLVKYARTHDNLIITPHIAGSTKDAWFKTQKYVIGMVIDETLKDS